MKPFKLRLIRRAKACGINVMYVSAEDYQLLVKAKEINANGNLREAQNIVIKTNGELSVGSMSI